VDSDPYFAYSRKIITSNKYASKVNNGRLSKALLTTWLLINNEKGLP